MEGTIPRSVGLGYIRNLEEKSADLEKLQGFGEEQYTNLPIKGTGGRNRRDQVGEYRGKKVLGEMTGVGGHFGVR